MAVQDKSRILEAFQGKNVLVVGDVMLDEYVWGDVNRISPEAPVPVVELRRRSYVCGGAANVAANVVSLGGKASLAGVAGEDEPAGRLRTLVEESGIHAEGLVADGTRATTTKVRIIAHSQQVLRVDTEPGSAISAEVEQALLRRIETLLPGMDACAISDYGKGVITTTVAREVIRLARRHGKPTVVDPKGVEYEKYRGATVVTPNVKEAEAVLGRRVCDEHEISEAGRSLIERLDGSSVILTRGADGMTIFVPAAEPLHIAARAHNVYDVTGAGDTVVGALALCLASGASLQEAALVANEAAGLVVGKVGTATVAVEELLKPTAGGR